MKSALLVSAVVAILIVTLIYFRTFRKRDSHSPESSQAPYPAPVEAYMGLRSQIFRGAREHLQLPPAFPWNEAWAVVMDWGVQRGVVTIVAVHDGTASMYYSTGGGSIGGGQAHESIRAAAGNALSVASRHTKLLKPVTEFPTPTHNGQIFFYVLTDSGVYFAEAPQEELASNRHPLSDLGNAMQAIVTEYRLILK